MQYDPHCPFCTKPSDEIIAENDLAKSFYDTKPANPGHVLVVPKSHVKTIFDCSAAQFLAIRALILRDKRMLDAKFQPGGYEIGMNCYPIGGQSVLHAHVHIIPRYRNQRRQQIFPHDKSAKFAGKTGTGNSQVSGSGMDIKRAWRIEERIMGRLKAKGEKITWTFINPDPNYFKS